MQKKTDKLLEKIVKKDYNNELEKVLEKKYFDENVKNLLLSILYKVEVAYKDYEKVKPNVETKEEYIQNIINIIQKECEDIKIVKMNSKESEMLGNKTFLVEKNKKRIICYPIERKLLYCISKIQKKDKIIKDKYYIINKTLSELINVGNNINTVEPMRDFNGYSWMTVSKEIESIYHNLAYQNIRILVGEQFLNKWISNNSYIMDYLEFFENKIEEIYGEKQQKDFMKELKKLSVLLAIKYNEKTQEALKKEKEKVELQLEKIQDSKKFVQETTKEKRKIIKEIKLIDETIHNKQLLQKEYEKRNEQLPLQEKIFSIKILSKIMINEREEKIKKIEELNTLLKPKKYVAYKRELKQKEEYLKLLEVKDLKKEIQNQLLKLQEVFLICYKTKIEKIENKQELMKLIYEFRYYCLIPFDEEKNIKEVEKIKNEREEIEKLLIQKAHELKIINIFSKNKELDYKLLKYIFVVRVINLEDLSLKLKKEEENYYIQLFDEAVFEEKFKIENFDKKDLLIKINKKTKIFN